MYREAIAGSHAALGVPLSAGNLKNAFLFSSADGFTSTFASTQLAHNVFPTCHIKYPSTKVPHNIFPTCHITFFQRVI